MIAEVESWREVLKITRRLLRCLQRDQILLWNFQTLPTYLPTEKRGSPAPTMISNAKKKKKKEKNK